MLNRDVVYEDLAALPADGVFKTEIVCGFGTNQSGVVPR